MGTFLELINDQTLENLGVLTGLLLDLGNGIYVSISNEGTDTPVTRPETDKAGQSPRDRKRGGGGDFKCY